MTISINFDFEMALDHAILLALCTLKYAFYHNCWTKSSVSYMGHEICKKYDKNHSPVSFQGLN